MNIYFDLDGVIRDLAKFIFGGDNIITWDMKKDGKTIIEIINSDLSIIEKSIPTKYYDVISLYEPIHIISCQPDDWRPYTARWVDKYLPLSRITYTDTAEEKLSMLEEFDVLVEDYPNFSDYSKIILIDTTYNQNVKGERMRIKEPIQLDYFLYSVGEKRGWREIDKVVDLFETRPL